MPREVHSAFNPKAPKTWHVVHKGKCYPFSYDVAMTVCGWTDEEFEAKGFKNLKDEEKCCK